MKEHYPRAEKETENNPDGLRWRIQQANSENTFKETTVCLIGLARYGAFDEVPGTGLPAAAVLGLIDTTHQIGKLKGAGELERDPSGSRATLLGYWMKLKSILGVDPNSLDDEPFRVLSSMLSDRKEALEQLSNLGAFIGHPGATPAHVVGETVSLIEKFLKASDLAGCKMDQTASRVAEEMLKCYLNNHNLRPTMIALAKRLGFTRETSTLDVISAVNSKLDQHEGTIANYRTNESSNAGARSTLLWLCDNMLPGYSEDANSVELGVALKAHFDGANEWRQSSENWQKRALAAEARLSGPVDFRKNEEPLQPGGTERLEWSELNSVLAKGVDPDEVSIRTRYGVAVLLRCRTMSLPGVPPFEVAEPVKRGEVQIPEEYLVKP